MRVNPIKITKDMKVSDLIKEMGSSGVLGAGRTYRATELLSKMFKDPDMKIFFTFLLVLSWAMALVISLKVKIPTTSF
ncbi:MAG: hypothetical protein KUA29_09030, partial [Methanobacterium sp.]|nr:hypothetical protein [Methanobacterium sp.]